MDGYVKMFLSIYECVLSTMALTHIGTKKHHKVNETYHKVSEAKILKNIGYRHDTLQTLTYEQDCFSSIDHV